MPYFTLYTRERGGKFGPQFGDYTRTEVEQERRDSYREYRGGDWRIIRSEAPPSLTESMEVASRLDGEG